MDYFLITLHTTELEDAGTTADVYVTIVGGNGDTGKRWLLKTVDGKDVNMQPGSLTTCQISGVGVGEPKQVGSFKW